MSANLANRLEGSAFICLGSSLSVLVLLMGDEMSEMGGEMGNEKVKKLQLAVDMLLQYCPLNSPDICNSIICWDGYSSVFGARYSSR